MQTLFNYLPLLNALFCLGIGLYVLSRNWKIAANIGFFVGMAALGGMEFAVYMGASTAHGVYASPYDKMFGAGEILLPASWFVFSLSFARAEASRSFERWRVRFDSALRPYRAAPVPVGDGQRACRTGDVEGGRLLGLRLPGALPDDHPGQPRIHPAVGGPGAAREDQVSSSWGSAPSWCSRCTRTASTSCSPGWSRTSPRSSRPSSSSRASSSRSRWSVTS